jgi:hypothetical protein
MQGKVESHTTIIGPVETFYMSSKLRFIGKTMAAALALALTAAAHADTYDYTGAALISVGLPPGTAVTGSFTINGVLGDNLTSVAIHPTSFSFTDDSARGTLTNSNVDHSYETFDISTNAEGEITGWDISLNNGTTSLDAADTSGLVGDTAYSVLGFGWNTTAGTWTDPTPAAVTPEPSSFVLLGTGILGLAGAARRKFLRA